MRLLDLFCGAGGAAMGYHRAGFEVVGVDHKPQPRYPFQFVQGDALSLLAGYLDGADDPWGTPPFDAFHASPPCQAFTLGNNSWNQKLGPAAGRHPDLVAETRRLLKQTCLPYVIENVPGAPLEDPVTICGLSLGLNVRRHRLFETSWPVMVPPCRDHDAEFLVVYGGGARRRAKQIGRTTKGAGGPILRRGTATLAEGQAAMGIDWMTRDELSQAIPPAYTELIGHQLAQFVRAAMAELGRVAVCVRATRGRSVIAALYVDPHGVYAGLEDVELWDEARDARLYAGPWPVVAHPPCARWSVLAPLVQSITGYRVGDDGGCFAAALTAVRAFGGVLEHPAHSLAWRRYELPRPAREGWTRSMFDDGWTTEVDQAAYGHPARKRTWLYAYGLEPPDLDWTSAPVTRQVSSFAHGRRVLEVERVRPRLASATPPAFRDALLSIAREAA